MNKIIPALCILALLIAMALAIVAAVNAPDWLTFVRALGGGAIYALAALAIGAAMRR